MNKKQEKIYNIIKKFIEENEYSPSMREIGKIANLKSVSSVYQYLWQLKDLGYIDFVEKKSRTIKILK